MLGILVVTHYRLADEFLQALELIVGTLEHVRAVGLDPGTPPEEMRRQIESAVAEVKQGAGVLMLVDMFGGTPSNLCMSFLSEDIEVVTGLNLPMLVKVARSGELGLAEAAKLASDYGRRNISVASEVLAGADRAAEDT